MSSEVITSNDLTNILNEVLPVYNSTGFVIKYYTATSATSVSANGGTAWFQVRVDSADDPVAIVGYYLNGGYGCSVYNLNLQTDANGHYASFAVRNGATTAASITATVYVLCKQELTHFTQAMADYIVEQGTDSQTGITWTYRKWNSGISECWGVYSCASKNYAAHNGNGFNPVMMSGLFNSTSNMVINASGRIDGVGASGVGFTYPNSVTQLQIWLVNYTAAAQSSKAGVLFIHVKGTWK